MRTALLAMALLAPGLTACRKKPPAPPAPRVAAQPVFEAAVAQAPVPTLRARFKLKVDGPTVDGGTRAGLVLDRPDRLRVDVLTPLGGPMLLMATDGAALHAWSQRDATFFRGDDAVAVLGELTGGVLGLSALLDLLVGRVPAEGLEALHLQPVDRGAQIILGSPELPDFRVRAVVDPTTLRLRELDVAPAAGAAPTALGAPVFTARYAGTVAVGERVLPAHLTVALPTLGWTLELDFLSWERLEEAPAVFELPVPPGATEVDLVERLRSLQAG